MTDPIADYLTRLRNAIQAKHRVVEVNTTIVDFGNVDTSNSDWDEFPNLLE